MSYFVRFRNHFKKTEEEFGHFDKELFYGLDVMMHFFGLFLGSQLHFYTNSDASNQDNPRMQSFLNTLLW